MNSSNTSGRSGFTLIELLMVILVIAILAVIGITQFVNYGTDSRNAATKANLQTLRRAISEKNGTMRLRCNVQTNAFPPVANINSNDITTIDGATQGGPCQFTDIPSIPDRAFLSSGIPVNPWSSSIHTSEAASKKVWDCSAAAGAGHDATTGVPTGACDPTLNLNCSTGAAYAYVGAVAGNDDESGWCYDSTSGKVWPNSRNNSGKNDHLGDENLY